MIFDADMDSDSTNNILINNLLVRVFYIPNLFNLFSFIKARLNVFLVGAVCLL